MFHYRIAICAPNQATEHHSGNLEATSLEEALSQSVFPLVRERWPQEHNEFARAVRNLEGQQLRVCIGTTTVYAEASRIPHIDHRGVPEGWYEPDSGGDC